MRVPQGIGTTASLAKAVGVRVGPRLGHGREGQRVERLHGAVVQGGDVQRAKCAVLLWDVYPALGFGSVSVTFEVLCGVDFLSIGSPYYIIYPGRFCAPA